MLWKIKKTEKGFCLEAQRFGRRFYFDVSPRLSLKESFLSIGYIIEEFESMEIDEIASCHGIKNYFEQDEILSEWEMLFIVSDFSTQFVLNGRTIDYMLNDIHESLSKFYDLHKLFFKEDEDNEGPDSYEKFGLRPGVDCPVAW